MKISPAFATLSHIIWSALFGLIVSGGTAVIQYNSTNGINIPQDASIFAIVILTGLGSTALATWKTIQKSPALLVAEAEVASVATAKATQLAQSAHGRIDEIVVWLQAHMQQSHAAPLLAQSANIPSSLKPTVLQPMSSVSTPVAPVSVPNTPPVGAVPLTTIPAMPVATQQ